SIQPAGSNFQTFTTDSFTVTAGSPTVISFVGLGPTDHDNTAFIDAVTLQLATQTPITDGGFENPASPFTQSGATDPLFWYNPGASDGSAWTFTAKSGTNGSGLSANQSAFTTGIANAPQGNQVAFLQGQASISQSITLAAGTYRLS